MIIEQHTLNAAGPFHVRGKWRGKGVSCLGQAIVVSSSERNNAALIRLVRTMQLSGAASMIMTNKDAGPPENQSDMSRPGYSEVATLSGCRQNPILT